MKKVFISIILFLMLLTNLSFAREEILENDDSSLIKQTTEQIMETTQKTLGISDFLKEADKYTQNIYGNINLSDIFSNIIKGK